MAVNLTVNVAGVSDVLLSFDVLRIKRSITGVDGTYNLITAPAPTSATLLSPTGGNYTVVGNTLQLIVDHGTQVDILFTGSDDLTTPQVADQINTAVGALVATDIGNNVSLTSTTDGTGSVIHIVGGSAAAAFGWVGGERDIGEDIYITLQSGLESYSFIDQDGSAGYFYKAQFLNTTNNLSSADSGAFEGDVGTLVSAGALSIVSVDLVDGRGIALPNQDITFYSQYDLLEVEGFQIGLSTAPILITTNNSGHAEVSLVRGSKWKVAFEGTSVIRDITVADAPTTNLLTAMGAAPDPFNISVLPYVAAPRRSL